MLVYAWMCAAAFILPTSAGAFATPGAEPTAGPPGLPDGRIYEQVSPTNKYGNSAAKYLAEGAQFPVMSVAADGNGAVFSATGPMGEAATGFAEWGVAKRSAGEWRASDPLPRASDGQGVLELSFTKSFDVSADVSKTLFGSEKVYNSKLVKDEKTFKTGFVESGQDPLYLSGAKGFPSWFGEALWIAEPQIPNPESWDTVNEPIPASYSPAGASSDLSTIYFNWTGTLAPGDNIPDPSFGGATRSSQHGMGFFEWKDGVLRYAGTLPDGTVDPYGAQSPEFLECVNGDGTRNQVSLDGSRAYFVSPAPERGAPSSDPLELYVHKLAPDGTTSSVLVSRDTLLPAVNGLPAGAPHSPLNLNFPQDPGTGGCPETSYMYASPDGSHVFFESVDRLTAAAPSDESIKEYEFDVSNETLTYLPGVTVGDEHGTSPIMAANGDGSAFVFEKNTENPGETLEVDLWSDGPNGPSDGNITPIVQMPSGAAAEIGPVHLVANGSVVVFDTSAGLSGFNNGGLSQVYRYDAGANTLTCVSCPPAGVTPSGASFTHDFMISEIRRDFVANRGVSDDGSRVFFDTTDGLVPQDVNGRRDVYEWENGSLLLISTGLSREDSIFGDNTPSGGDVIFSTSQNIAPGDTDEAYDVYDARIPRPGDTLPPKSLPCSGDVCQGPPNVPVLFGAPASASFNGLGNQPPAKPTLKKVAHKAKKHKKHRKHKKRKARGHGTTRKSISTTKGKR
jgi:hypothetical protein